MKFLLKNPDEMTGIEAIVYCWILLGSIGLISVGSMIAIGKSSEIGDCIEAFVKRIRSKKLKKEE